MSPKGGRDKLVKFIGTARQAAADAQRKADEAKKLAGEFKKNAGAKKREITGKINKKVDDVNNAVDGFIQNILDETAPAQNQPKDNVKAEKPETKPQQAPKRKPGGKGRWNI